MERAVREHAGVVYRVARAVLRDHHDAEDAAQEVFLRVLRLRRGLEGIGDTRTWFARVAFRVALDRRRRPGVLSLEEVRAEGLRSGEAAADDVAADRQVRALVAEKVAALPGDLRHSVRLSTVAELSSPEIASVLGIPEGTVRTRLMRARRILRVALAAALALVLAVAGGILLRKRKSEEKISSKGEEPRAGAPAEPAPSVAQPAPPRISSKGEEMAVQPARPRLARGPSASYPSTRIVFPSPNPLSEQELLLLSYVSSTDPAETASRGGFLDEPAPLPPLPEDQPSS
jgi:RNA polymerase sigma-70 factor (ECF subfamily)